MKNSFLAEDPGMVCSGLQLSATLHFGGAHYIIIDLLYHRRVYTLCKYHLNQSKQRID